MPINKTQGPKEIKKTNCWLPSIPLKWQTTSQSKQPLALHVEPTQKSRAPGTALPACRIKFHDPRHGETKGVATTETNLCQAIDRLSIDSTDLVPIIIWDGERGREGGSKAGRQKVTITKFGALAMSL